MRVALVNPPPLEGVRYTREGRCQEKEGVLGAVKPPLTLLYLASILRDAGHEIILLDANARRMAAQEMQQRLHSFSPEMTIFATSTPTLRHDMAAMEGSPGEVFAFGAHLLALPRETLEEYEFLDGAFVAEPETVVLQLCNAVSGRMAMGSVAGLACRKHDGNIFVGSSSGKADLNSLPVPAWDLLDFEDYLLPNNGKPFCMVEIARGCPFNCPFCVVPLVRGGPGIREKDPERVLKEIEYIKEKFGVGHFYLLRDSTLRSNDSQISAISEGLVERKTRIKWMTNTRIDGLDLGVLRKMKESGCWLLATGIEADTDEMLQEIHKGISRKEIEEGVAKARQSGISLMLFFIFGLENDSEEKMARRGGYAASLDVDFANFYPLVPYPGTQIFKRLVEPEARKQDWGKYNYSNYVLSEQTGLSEKAVMGAISGAYLKFYTNPGRLLRMFFEGRGEWKLSYLLSNGARFALRILRS